MKTNQDPQMTFEELTNLDKDLANVNFGTTQEAAALDLSGKLSQICTIYKKVKPILGIILSIPFIPGNIKNALRTFMSVMDTICV